MKEKKKENYNFGSTSVQQCWNFNVEIYYFSILRTRWLKTIWLAALDSKTELFDVSYNCKTKLW